MKHYRVVFLSMSCDLPLYRAQAAIIEKTWAKPVIDGKWPEYAYYSFTECDKDHPKQGIDGCTIYIDTTPGLFNTYQKNRQALIELRKAGVTADFIVRTNTATFINIANFNKMLPGISDKKLTGNICPQWCIHKDNTLTFNCNIVGGNFLVMPEWVVDEVIAASITADNASEWALNGSMTPVDDFLINAVVVKNHPELLNQLDPVPLVRYKTFVSELFQKPPFSNYDKLNVHNTIDDTIRSAVFIQLKMPNARMMFRYIEIDHMIELYDALV